jgi:hypothetical protein
MSKELLDTCLRITGSYENGSPAYDGLTGNFDGQGMSVGVLQWCAGQGSLGHLLAKIAELSSVEDIDANFSVPVSSMIEMSGAEQKQFVMDNFLPDGMKLSPEATAQWKAFLSSQPSVDAQVALAESGVLAKAINYADQYVSNGSENARVVAFFFDIVTQSGGMKNSRGSVAPYAEGDTIVSEQAVELAKTKSAKTAAAWGPIIANDPLANLLLHYAYQRALLSKPEYVWDALSRRGTIACRTGVVHGKMFDFTKVLP